MNTFTHFATCIFLVTALAGSTLLLTESEPVLEEIHGYHFHTYFFQDNSVNRNEALVFRDQIQSSIDAGILTGCRLNNVNLVPRGPHPIGSYETCCNKTAISPALSWFMQNHANLSVLLHPLTRYEVQDHTNRAMFLGPKVPLDISALQEDLEDNLDMCLPIELSQAGNGKSTRRRDGRRDYKSIKETGTSVRFFDSL